MRKKAAPHLTQPARPRPFLGEAFTRRRARLLNRAAAGEAVNVNAEHDVWTSSMTAQGNSGRFPPHRMSLKESLGHPAGVLVPRCVRELLVATKHDEAGPYAIGGDLFALQADQGVRSHPFDLATERGISVQELAVQIDAEWNDIGLVVPGTRQAGDVVSCQHRPAFLDRHR